MLRRLLMLSVLPAVAVLVAGFVVGRAARVDAREAAATADVAELSMSAAGLDSALGAETVASADGFRNIEPEAVYQRTNDALEAFSDVLETTKVASGQAAVAADRIEEMLALRADVQAGVISPLQIVDRYGTERSRLRSAVENEALRTSPDRSAVDVSHLLALSNAAGAHIDERLAVDLALRYGTWAPGQQAVAVGAIERQALHLARAERGNSRRVPQPGAALEAARIEILTSSELPSVGRDQWLAMSAEWSDQLGAAVQAQATRALDRATIDQRRADRSLLLTIGGGIFVFLFTLGSALTLSWRLVARIRRIGEAASQLAEYPEQVVRINDGRDDDIGGLAQTFEAMAERVRTATRNQRLESAALETIVEQRPLAETLALCNEMVSPGACFVAHDNGRTELHDLTESAGPTAVSIENLPSGPLRLASGLVQTAARSAAHRRDLEHRANHDPLTGLFDRRRILNEIEGASDGGPLGVLFIDLDGFKVVNDTYGHSFGDELLVRVAQRIESFSRQIGGLPGRLGGDEFIVVAPGIGTEKDLEALGHQVLAEVTLATTGRADRVTASVGGALSRPGQSRTELLAEADTAMYAAKSQDHPTVVISNAELRESIKELASREHRMIQCLTADDLAIHYQPIWDVRGHRTLGLEALTRPGPTYGNPSPAALFEDAGRLGLAAELDLSICRKVSQQVMVWMDAGLAVPPVAINLSAQSLTRETLVEDLEEVLALTGCPARALMLEVTENVLLGDVDAVARRLRRLGDLGFGLAIDDFGAGYSSLSYLAKLPVDQLKIDRTFVSKLHTDATNRSIVESVIGLAKTLGMDVVAEGVEEEAERAVLESFGCHMIQGFLFARPEPAEAAERRMRSVNATPTKSTTTNSTTTEAP